MSITVRLFLVALLLGGCSHDYDNPVEAGPAGSVTGTVVQHLQAGQTGSTEPVPGAVCTLEGTQRSATTDVAGFFEIVSVADGSYILICRSQNGLGADLAILQVVEVVNGAAIDLGILVATRPGAISGFAFLQEQTLHRGIQVAIPRTSILGVTNDDGAFTLDGIPEGTYETVLSADGYLDVVLTGVKVYSQTTTEIEPVTLPLSTGPSGSILIEEGAAFSLNRSVTVSVVASEAAVRMMLSTLPSFSGAEWQPVADLVPWTFVSDGEKTLYARFSDANGLDSATVEDSIIIDTLPPAGATLVINNGAELAGSTEVVLTLFAADDGSGVSEMQVSNDPTFTNVSWEAYATTHTWTLTPGDGLRTVYARFRDRVGHVGLDIASDTIEVDTSAPSDGTIWFGEGEYTQTANVTLLSAATNATQMIISRDELFSAPITQPYATSTPLWLSNPPAPAEDGLYTIWVKFVDSVGNTSAPASASITLDTTAPTLPALLTDTVASNQNSIFVPFTSGSMDANPDVYLAALDSPNPTWLEVTEGNEGGYDGVWIDFPGTEDGELTFVITARDAAGNLPLDGVGQVSSVSVTAILDRVAPELPAYDLLLAREVTLGFEFEIWYLPDVSPHLTSYTCDLDWGLSSPNENNLQIYGPAAANPPALVLQSMTTYLAEVRCQDEAGNVWTSPQWEVKTGAIAAGAITTHTTLSSSGGQPIWIDSTIVSDGVTLTLAAGVHIRGMLGYGVPPKISGVNYDILAIGTSSSPVRVDGVDLFTDGSATIQHAELTRGKHGLGGGVWAYQLLLEDSRISSITVETGMSGAAAAPGPCTLRRNAFHGAAFASTDRCENATVENNWFSDESSPLQVSQATVVRHNTLHSVSVHGDYIPVTGTVVLENNYWGTTDMVEILDNRIDLTQVPDATVDFLPLLTSPHAGTPPPWEPGS